MDDIEFGDFYGADGELQERFLPVEEILVPGEIELSGDESQLVVPDYDDYFNGIGRPVSVNERCFLSFLNLGDASAETIHRFAQKWGLLGLCEHGEPARGHRLRRREARLSIRVSLVPDCQENDSEAVADWRRYANQFTTILNLGVLLRQPKPPATSGLWGSLPVPKLLVSRARKEKTEKQLLVSIVNTLLAASTIQPIASWSKRPKLQFGCRDGTTLFAALTFELAMAVSDCKIAFCSYCHKPYEPHRRPRIEEANSCPSCRQLANAARVQRCRDRKRGERIDTEAKE